MASSSITVSPQEMAVLRAFVMRMGRHGEPSDINGLRMLARASDIVPDVVHRGDDILLFTSLEGGLVIGAVRDDGGVTYARMDNANNLRVTLPAVVINILTTLLATAQDNVTATDAVRAEVGKLVAGLSARSALIEPARMASVETQPVPLLASRQGHLFPHDLGYIAEEAQRKFVGVDAGAYTSPAAPAAATDTTSAVTFTGVLLTGRVRTVYNVTDDMFHTITTIVDPAGGAVGTLTVTPAIPTANAVLRIPYTDVPHAWNSAADALQTLAVVGDPPRINGPATFISQTAATDNGTYQWVLPCALYGRFSVQIVWSTAAGTRTWQFRSYGKIDDAAWPVPAGGPPTVSTINAAYTIDTLWQYHASGTQFGAVAAGNGYLIARFLEPTGYNSIAIEAVVAGDDANNSTVTAYVTLYGGTK